MPQLPRAPRTIVGRFSRLEKGLALGNEQDGGRTDGEERRERDRRLAGAEPVTDDERNAEHPGQERAEGERREDAAAQGRAQEQSELDVAEPQPGRMESGEDEQERSRAERRGRPLEGASRLERDLEARASRRPRAGRSGSGSGAPRRRSRKALRARRERRYAGPVRPEALNSSAAANDAAAPATSAMGRVSSGVIAKLQAISDADAARRGLTGRELEYRPGAAATGEAPRLEGLSRRAGPGVSGSRKTTSIAKRMNRVWIEREGGRSSPSPASRPRRPKSPRKRLRACRRRGTRRRPPCRRNVSDRTGRRPWPRLADTARESTA